MSDLQSIARSALADVVGEQQLGTADPEDRLVDLGLDSVGLISFAVKLEEMLAHPLSDRHIAILRDATLGELDQLITDWGSQFAVPTVSRRSGPEIGTGPADESPHPGIKTLTTRARSLKARDAASALTVRTFRESDRGEMAELCRQTCTYTWLQAVAHLLWLYQYLDQEPDACFVVELEGRIIAYWVGTCDEPTLADGFRTHMRRYIGEFVRGYLALAGKTFSPRRHARFWMLMVGAMIRPRLAFRLYNRRDRLGPVLGMTKAHFQVSPSHRSAGVVFELARAWLQYLAMKDVDVTCLPSFPAGHRNDEGAVAYWRRIGYHPVRFGSWTLLIALVQGPEVGPPIVGGVP
jgi:acyl carrier protein/ribosomal protein S18 acetylase RimI-like enzyme